MTGAVELETSIKVSELPDVFTAYAYLPETKTEAGPDPVLAVATTDGEAGLEILIIEIVSELELAT